MPIIPGMCSMVAFSYYGNKIRAEFQDPNFKAQKYVQFLIDMDKIFNKLIISCININKIIL